jgi:hypothetical protein
MQIGDVLTRFFAERILGSNVLRLTQRTRRTVIEFPGKARLHSISLFALWVVLLQFLRAPSSVVAAWPSGRCGDGLRLLAVALGAAVLDYGAVSRSISAQHRWRPLHARRFVLCTANRLLI